MPSARTTHPFTPAAIVVCALASMINLSCLDSKTTRCSWGHICPEGRICDPVGQTCIHPSQELICRGVANGEPCTPDHAGDTPHVCVAEICRRSHCGDGITDSRPGADERCDDGNTEAGDGCRADCRGLELCPDGLLDIAAGEVCDDGNLDNNDQCTIFCDRIDCGDGVVSGLEQCDHGVDNSDVEPDACRSECTLPACEDDVVDAPDRPLCWASYPERQVTTNASRILAADFNNDQRDDILVWSVDRGRFEVHWSTGDGAFEPAPGSPHVVGTRIESLVVADVNADGVADVVVAREPDPSLQVYLGDPTAGLSLVGPAGCSFCDLNDVTVGDLDGDQVPDLAAMYDSTCSIHVIPGNGDGTFGSYTSASVRSGHCWSVGMHIEDLNADGAADLVVATGDDGVFVMQGNGVGLNSPAVYEGPTFADSSVRDVAVFDVNGDGLADILYPEQHPPQSPLRVLLNQGSFQFVEAPETPLPLGLASLRLDVGDIDGDGHTDLAVVDLLATAVFLVFGGGDGTFTVLTPPQDGMAMSADDVAFGQFYDHPYGGLGMLKIAEHRVAFWAFEP